LKHNIAGRLFLNHDKLKHIGHPRLLVSTALWLLLITSCQSGNATNTQSQESLFTIAPGSPISIPGEPGNVVIGDVNNDKKLDLVVALGKNRSITVLPGKGDGQFAAPAGTTTVPDSPGDMALGDVNGDGKLDLAIVTHDSYGASLLLGDGKGGFSIAPNSPIVMKVGQHPHTHGLALADMNRDNKLDLVTVNNATTICRSLWAMGVAPSPLHRARHSPLVQVLIRLRSATSMATASLILSRQPLQLVHRERNNWR
jgi:hypothetical protein